MRSSSNQRGFSLPELMVALVVGSVVMAVMFKTFLGSHRATSNVTEQIEHRQNARTALQLLERELRMAGSGWGRTTVEGCWKGSPLSIDPIKVGYGGSPASNDSIVMIGAFDAATTLTSSMSGTTKSTRVASLAGFSTNDLFVVTNGTNAHLFQVTGSISSPAELLHATTSNYNVAGGHLNWPSGGYPTGSQVYRATYLSYRVDATGSRKKLVRREAGRTDQLVAFDVTQFEVWYELLDGSLTRAPDDTSTYEQIVPVIQTQVIYPGRPAVADSATTAIRPRSF